MRILLIGPEEASGGSITPYLHGLAAGLRARGCRVDRVASGGVPWDPARGGFLTFDEVRAAAAELLRGHDLAAYDLLSIHFGKLEIEQLIPVLWEGIPRAPAVHHLHSLSWDLFRGFIPEPGMAERVEEATWSMEGFVFFGRYAEEWCRAQAAGKPRIVSFLPHTPAAPRADGPRLSAEWRSDRPLASMTGFASPWKDAESLLAAFERVTTPLDFVLAGPLWSERIPFRTREIGAVRVTVVDAYLDGDASANLIRQSDFGIFPYVEHATFQGSGALPNYLFHGIPVVAFDSANLAEQIADAGVLVPAGNRDRLARAIEAMASDAELRARTTAAARARAPLFDPQRHADECLAFYREVVRRHRDRGSGG